MQMDAAKPVRRNARLAGFDYAQDGAYFVTMVTHGRACMFGDVVAGEIQVNPAGEMVDAVWRELPAHYPGVGVDWYVVMPNHFHGIVVLTSANNNAVGAGSPGPDRGNENTAGGETPPLPRPSLPNIVAYFKYETTKRVNVQRGTAGARLWQRSYYDHIIRDDDDLTRAREYIALNPARWADDVENLANTREHERRGMTR